MCVLTLGKMLRRQFSHDTGRSSIDSDSQYFDRRYVAIILKFHQDTHLTLKQVTISAAKQ